MYTVKINLQKIKHEFQYQFLCETKNKKVVDILNDRG